MLRHAFSQAPGTHTPHKPPGVGEGELDTHDREQLPECGQKATDGAQTPHNRTAILLQLRLERSRGHCCCHKEHRQTLYLVLRKPGLNAVGIFLSFFLSFFCSLWYLSFLTSD